MKKLEKITQKSANGASQDNRGSLELSKWEKLNKVGRKLRNIGKFRKRDRQLSKGSKKPQ